MAPSTRCCFSPSIPATTRSSMPPARRWPRIPTCSYAARSPARSAPAIFPQPCIRVAEPTRRMAAPTRASRSSASRASRRRRARNCRRPRPIFARCRPGRSPPTTPSAKWEAELAKFGFAIIHNKIVVIDPFSDDCTVVTGSHNLGFRASHNNDENMVIIRGHRALAQAYACHVLDIYDHYAWRFLLKQHPDIFGKPLQPDDTWQERYIVGADEKSPELRFWLSAATGGDTSAAGAPPRPAAPASPPRQRQRSPQPASPSRRQRVKPTASKTAGKAAKTAAKKKTAKKASAGKSAKKKPGCGRRPPRREPPTRRPARRRPARRRPARRRPATRRRARRRPARRDRRHRRARTRR